MSRLEREPVQGRESSPKRSLEELQASWLKKTREAWLLKEERLRDTVLVRKHEDEEKISQFEPFHDVAHFDDDGVLYISRWVALAEIDDPRGYVVLWPRMRSEKMTDYLTHLPQYRPFLFRAQLVRVSGVEKAMRMTDHVRQSYRPSEGVRNLETKELVSQIRRLLMAYGRSRELSPRAVQDLHSQTVNLIRNSGFFSTRLPRIQEAVKRVLEASDMKDRTGRLNPSACRQMLYSALVDLSTELELKQPQIQIKYAALKEVLGIYREQMRWTLTETKFALIHFLKSAPYRQSRLLATMSAKELMAMKRGMVAHLEGLCQELEGQVKFQPYKSVVTGVILGLRGGEEESYQAVGWRGDSATELITQGYFIRAGRRIKFCLRRINNVLQEYESLEKKED
jgi:hypothetical protein